MVDLKAYADSVESWSATKQWREEAECLLALANVRTGDKVLDVGTNKGRMLGLLTQKFAAHAIGVEPNHHAYTQASRRGYQVFRFLGDAVEIEPGYDVALLSHVLGHVNDPTETLALISEGLKPGGRIGLILPNPAYERVMQTVNWLTGYRSDPTFRHLIGVKQLRQLLPTDMYITRTAYVGDKVPMTPNSWRGHLIVVAQKKG